MSNIATIEAQEREFALVKSRFEIEQRMAQAMITSSILPQHYRNVGDVMVLNEMSRVLSIPTVMLAQQLYVVKGKPAMSGQLVIAILNGSKRFDKPIMWEERESPWGIRAYTYIDGERVDGEWLDDNMIKANGWESNTKWKTMKSQMARYRTASWFGRLYAPDILLGFQEQDEVIDTVAEVVEKETGPADLNALLAPKQVEKEVPHNEETGEVIEAQVDEEPAPEKVDPAISSKYPLFIKAGVKRKDLQSFVQFSNLTADNVDAFVGDEELIETAIGNFYFPEQPGGDA